MYFSGATNDGQPYVIGRTPMQRAIRASKAKYKIISSGRRSGKTYGAADDIIQDCLTNTGKELLWVDVQYNQVLGYVEKYFLPKLRRLKSSYWDWQISRRNLHINGNLICFRSCDKPDNIVGNGFWRIVLNEAGIQLFDTPELWDQYIAPMMLDYPDSTATLIGTPRGTIDKNCNESMFYKMAQMGTKNSLIYDQEYEYFKYSTYDNPRLPRKEIKKFEDSIHASLRAQEIYGEFIDQSASQIFNPAWWKYVDDIEMPNKTQTQVKYLSIDTAFKDKAENDESACTSWVKTWDNKYYIDSLWHDRLDYPNLCRKIKELIIQHCVDYVLIEDKASGQSLIQTIKNDLPGVVVKAFDPGSKDKVDRAAAITSMIESGRVFMKKAYWNRDIVNQATVFPLGNHDDIVDTISMALLHGKQKEGGRLIVDTVDCDHSIPIFKGYN